MPIEIELEFLSPGAYNVREGERSLGTVRKIGCNWYAIRRGNRIGCGGNLRSGAVDILSAFAAPSGSSSGTNADASTEVPA